LANEANVTEGKRQMRDLRQDELSHVYGGGVKGTDNQKKTDHKADGRSDRKTDRKTDQHKRT
jgi:hypothetical protein